MATSSVGIANLALTMLSTSRITSLTQDDENARKVNAIYTLERDSLLAEHNWNFARTEAELALLDEEAVAEDWAYIYQLPSDCLRVIRMELNGDFAVFSNKLYTNETPANIEYISRVEDEGQFTALFIKAFAARIAMILAYGITQSSTVAQLMEGAYEKALNEAKWADAQEGIGVPLQKGSLINSRQK